MLFDICPVVYNFDAPEIVRVTGEFLPAIARDFILVLLVNKGGSNVVRVEAAVRGVVQ
jgi:hypothetical protein